MAKGGVIRSALDELRASLKTNPEFANWFKESQAVDENGLPLRVFHGSNRIDRFEEGIKASRASSGPMPFFTDDPEIASKYATGKQDNSLEDTGYEQWFTYRPKGSRTDKPLSRMWYDMTPQQRADFNARMRHIGTNEDTGEIEDQKDVGGGVAPSHWDWLISPQNGEHRGNGLSAAVDMWLQSANLYNDEDKFLQVLDKAGLDTSKVKFTDFRHGAPGVLPAYLSAQNPLVTSSIPPEVVESLQDAADRQRRYGKSEREFMRGVDPWDKAYKDPDVWMDALRKGVESSATGGNPGYAWTSIPDWVTKTLKGLGYDSIRDVGGKMGGEGHDVWIPFEPTQIKSSVGNRGTYDPTKADINKAKGGKITIPRTELDALREYAHGLTPQMGMFSTLDQLVQQAPFETGFPEQWRGYLKPGRMLSRDEMQFPLKQEELDYALSPAMKLFNQDLRSRLDVPIPKDELLEKIRSERPQFGQTMRGYPSSVLESPVLPKTWSRPEWNVNETPTRVTTSPRVEYGPDYDERLSHQTPESTYQEAITELANLNHPSHFGNSAVSWARTSSHDLPSGEKMRLIEEIQSDLHQQAAEKINVVKPHYADNPGVVGQTEGLKNLLLEHAGLKGEFDSLYDEATRLWQQKYSIEKTADNPTGELPQPQRGRLSELQNRLQELVDQAYEKRPRVGYRDPEQEKQVKDSRVGYLSTEGTVNEALARLEDAKSKVPDAPFKDPVEYAQLEIRKQLLNAADEGEDYLGMARGSDQRDRYGGAGEGTEYFYDKLYPSVMKKLAKQYGAEMVEVPLQTKTGVDIRPDAMRRLESEDMDEFLDNVERGRYYGRGDPYHNIIDELSAEFPDSPQVSSAADNATQAVDRWNDVRQGGEDTSDELQDLNESMNRLWFLYKDRMGSATTHTKTFPAIKLTPEVRERIKRIGAPLFSVGVGAAPFVGPTQDEAGEPEGHAKGGKIQVPRTALDTLKEYHNALAPQLGMFSTLDKLIETAPFERGSPEQWRNYLKPGRPFEREGVQFPLKKEELEHSELMKTLNALELNQEGAQNLSKLLPTEQGPIDPTSPNKEQLLTLLRRQRPEFSLYASFPEYHSDYREFKPLGGELPRNARSALRNDPDFAESIARSRVSALAQNYEDYAHQTPGSRYEESATALSGLKYRSHYTADTLSHSRTTTHDIKGERNEAGALLGPGRVRLIEEIQSDPHQDAAEKVLGRRTPAESKEYGEVQELSRQLQNELETPDLSPETSQEIVHELSAARQRLDELANIPETRRARRGYMSRDELAEFHDLTDKMRNSAEDNGWTPEQAQAARYRYQELTDKHQNAVPDAPFKDAADYGRLEMRKQLLNAANNGEDYLALTNPEDQIERYSLEGKDADAMHHIYGNVYRKEMEKLAKQYGAEMTTVPLKSVTEQVDTRPGTMQNWGEEDMGALVDRLLHRDKLNEITQDGGLLHELGFGTLEPGYRDIAHSIVQKVDKARDLTQELRAASDEQALAQTQDEYELLGLDRDDPDLDISALYTKKELRAEVNEKLQEHADRVQEARDNLVGVLDDLYGDYNDVQKQSNVQTKTFPAIKLTPEIREKIKRVGTPLFSIGAGVAPFVGPLQEQQDEQQPDQPQTFAEGGDVEGDDDYSPNPFSHHSKAEEQSSLDELKQLMQHAMLGAETGWMHYEPGHGVGKYETPGTARPFIHYKEGATNENTPIDPETGMLLAPMEIEKPDVVDELASLPELLTLGHGPQFSKNASERSQALDDIMREDLGVKPPSSFLEYLAEAGGSMLGQLPTGDIGAGVRGLTGASKIAGPLRHLLKIPASAAEWFSPTIVPSVRNYIHGTLAGTGITMGLPALTSRLSGSGSRFTQGNEDIEQDVKNYREPPTQDDENQDFLNTFVTGN